MLSQLIPLCESDPPPDNVSDLWLQVMRTKAENGVMDTCTSGDISPQQGRIASIQEMR